MFEGRPIRSRSRNPPMIRRPHLQLMLMLITLNTHNNIHRLSRLESCLVTSQRIQLFSAPATPGTAGLLSRHHSPDFLDRNTSGRLKTQDHVFVQLNRCAQAGDPGQARQTRRTQTTACSAPERLHLGAAEWRCIRGTLKQETRYVIN